MTAWGDIQREGCPMRDKGFPINLSGSHLGGALERPHLLALVGHPPVSVPLAGASGGRQVAIRPDMAIDA